MHRVANHDFQTGEPVKLTRSTLMRNFQLQRPARYHAEALRRTEHLRSEHLREAAVLIGFIERDSGLNVLFTRRAMHLRHHPGQVSFPGGKKETDDLSVYHTAIRETFEETGIRPDQIEIFGHLPELATISRFAVTPVLAFIDQDYQLTIDKNEVDEAFEVPADYVFSKTNLFTQTFQIKDTAHRIFAIPYQHHFIWGMTAQIIQAMQKQIA
ncbi:CoA pyrophosphatase [Vibrio sp. V38_P2S17PM301]|nr:CoA pyrophosphatase [Vibrio sp. V37_P2S8PM304]NAW57545.1 CoA pyrophosphatase [Vibrio sp. V36_P2S2PM302]NAX27941.1 CoA pyrophosphatase [Vibrio sp. V38_P2S17PM301]NAX28882.1 CoA pyrophosphatase [Vibrio sp. V37_P2S8PM304]